MSTKQRSGIGIWMPAALAAAFLLAGATSLRAEDGLPGVFGIGAHASYYGTSDADDGDFKGGVQVRWRLSEAFALEGALDPRKEEFEDATLTVEGYILQASALFYLLTERRAAPYLLAGGSWYRTDVEQRFDDANATYEADDFGFHGGGGFEAALSDHATFHADVRYHFLDVDYGEDTLDNDGFSVQAGFTLFF